MEFTGNEKYQNDNYKTQGSKQSVANMKRMKEIERTFNVNLTKPSSPKISDPFLNDNKPMIDKISSKYMGINKGRSSTYQKAGQSQIFNNSDIQNLNVASDKPTKLDYINNSKRNILQESRDRKQSLLNQLNAKRVGQTDSTSINLPAEPTLLGITGQTTGTYQKGGKLENCAGLQAKTYRIQNENQYKYVEQQQQYQRPARLQSYNGVQTPNHAEQLLKIDTCTTSEYDSRTQRSGLPRPNRIVPRPVIQSQNYSHGEMVRPAVMHTQLDIAARRRQIASLRGNPNQMEINGQSSYNQSQTAQTVPVSRSHTHQQHNSQVDVNNQKPICQNGFQGIGMQDYNSQQITNDVTAQSENITITNSLTGASRIGTNPYMHQNQPPQTQIISNKPCLTANVELTDDLIAASRVATAEKSEQQSEMPKQPDFNKVTSTSNQVMLDYMFILMSNEQFQRLYNNMKIYIKPKFGEDGNIIESPKKEMLPAQSPKPINLRGPAPTKIFGVGGELNGSPKMTSPAQDRVAQMKAQGPDLSGLVAVKHLESQYSNEVPSVSCSLTATQLDYMKILMCKEDYHRDHKLTSDASDKLEIEKQLQVKKYMDDIISKLSAKSRKHKVSYKKKFVEEALQAQYLAMPEKRTSQVYVVVINREKDYDPVISQKMYQIQKRARPVGLQNKIKKNNIEEQSSSDDDVLGNCPNLKANTRLREIRKSNIDGTTRDSCIGKYASDNETGGIQKYKSASKNNTERLSSANTCSTQPQGIKNGLTADKQGSTSTPESVLSKAIKPIMSRPFRVEPYQFKWVPPVKQYPDKYKKPKIKIYQDINTHKHHKTHKLNVFFDQYNEFIRLVFKNSKAPTEKKFNVNYAVGLAKALGIRIQKDMFSEQNLKSREHITQLKQQLAFKLMNKIKIENKDIFPTPPQGRKAKKQQQKEELNAIEKQNSVNSELEKSTDATPKLNNGNKKEQIDDDKLIAKAELQWMYKYSIGKGNNALMVRSLFKNRFWWMKADVPDMDRVNFMWTQIKNIAHMETLLCKFPEKKSSLNMTKNQPKSFNQEYLHPLEPAQKKLLETKLYNKVEDNFHLANKKALLLNMKNYYEARNENVFDNLPVTFHIKNGTTDSEFKKFEAYYDQMEEDVKERKALRIKQKHRRMNSNAVVADQSPDKGEDDILDQKLPPMKNIWIIKPGENTNCGNGIQVASDFDEIIDIIEESNEKNHKRTCIVQKYIHNPMLIHKRKFDIRTYAMLTSVGGSTKAYVYNEGYIRTSSYEYDVNNLSDRLIHLTNDAIQKKDKNAYGKFEMGNKMSYIEFQTYIDKAYPNQHICFDRDFIPQMDKLTADVFRATFDKLDPKRRQNTFEVFGLDFMIDDEFKLYLIEINTNPCLELSSPLLARMIPNMLENAFKLVVDPMFPPPENYCQKKGFFGDPCPENRFKLIYDEKVDRPGLDDLYKQRENIIVELDEEELSDEEEHPDDAAEPDAIVEEHVAKALMNID